jgi:hypothetical protein
LHPRFLDAFVLGAALLSLGALLLDHVQRPPAEQPSPPTSSPPLARAPASSPASVSSAPETISDDQDQQLEEALEWAEVILDVVATGASSPARTPRTSSPKRR